MLDNTALERIGSQLGNLGINIVSLERDIELQQETIRSKQEQIENLEKDLALALEQRDGLQREVHRLEGIIDELDEEKEVSP